MFSPWLKKLQARFLLVLLLAGISNNLHAKEVNIGMGNFEPYFIEKGETGIFTDIINLVFAQLEDYHPRYLWGLSNNQLWLNFEAGELDAVSNLFDSVKLNACRTAPIFRFRDVAISNASDHYKINNINDLWGKNIVTFEGAKDFFGEEFSSIIRKGFYREVAKPHTQVRELHKRRADVSVGDMFIFLHSIKNKQEVNSRPQDFSFHDIFPAISSRMGFQDEKVCTLFNEALKKIRKNGQYEKVYHSYLRKLNYVF